MSEKSYNLVTERFIIAGVRESRLYQTLEKYRLQNDYKNQKVKCILAKDFLDTIREGGLPIE